MRAQPAGTCFDKTRNYARGNCDAARFAVSEVRQKIPTPAASAVHLFAALPKGAAPAEPKTLAGTPRGAMGGEVTMVATLQAARQRRTHSAAPHDHDVHDAASYHVRLVCGRGLSIGRTAGSPDPMAEGCTAAPGRL